MDTKCITCSKQLVFEGDGTHEEYEVDLCVFRK